MELSKQSNEKLFKIMLIGDPAVGKTSFLIRYTKNVFHKNEPPTIISEYVSKQLLLSNQEIVKLQMWDTSGSEKYKAITTSQYRKAVGALLFYDLTDMQSYNNTQKWLEEIHNQTEPGIVIMLIGNKLDLIESQEKQRCVPKETVQKFVQSKQLLYYETSAKSGQNVKESIEILAQKIYEEQIKKANNFQQGIQLESNPAPRPNGGCCNCK